MGGPIIHPSRLRLVVVFATFLFCLLSHSGDGREVLPPIAYFNRTLYPPLVLYRDSGEHLRIFQKLQLLTNERDYELLTAKNIDRAQTLSNEIAKWESLTRELGVEKANTRVEAEDGPLPERPLLSMAIVSDIQYAPKEETKRRHFKLSQAKLEHAVAEIIANRSQHVDLMMNLGDTVDDDIKAILPEILPIFDQLQNESSNHRGPRSAPVPVYHMLGNHDFLGAQSGDFDTLHKLLRMPSRYYALDAVTQKQPSRGADATDKQISRTFRLIILDGNDLAIYSTEPGSQRRRQAEEMLGLLKRRRAKNAQIFNGGLSSPQIEWLKTELSDACATGKLVFIFLHHPMRPRNEPTNLWNDVEVVPIIASYGCVLAVINGHAHKFLYDYQHTTHRDMHFITFGGMVQSPFTSWGFVDVFEDKLRVHGLIFGRPIDYWYDISDKNKRYHYHDKNIEGFVEKNSFDLPNVTRVTQLKENENDAFGTRPTIFVSSAPPSGQLLRQKDVLQLQTIAKKLSNKIVHDSGSDHERESDDLVVGVGAKNGSIEDLSFGSDPLTLIGSAICLLAVLVVSFTLRKSLKCRSMLKAATFSK